MNTNRPNPQQSSFRTEKYKEETDGYEIIKEIYRPISNQGDPFANERIAVFQVKKKLDGIEYVQKTINKKVIQEKCSGMEWTATLLRSIESEPYFLNTLNHPHILKMTDFKRDDTYIHIYTPYYKDGHLEQYLFKKLNDECKPLDQMFPLRNESIEPGVNGETQQLTNKQQHLIEIEEHRYKEKETKMYNELRHRMVRYMYQIASALLYLKKEQIIHRDIKPENIAVNGDVVALIDLGQMTRLSDGADGQTRVVSTIGFKAPEIDRSEDSEKYGCQVDVYSFATSFFKTMMKVLCRSNGEETQHGDAILPDDSLPMINGVFCHSLRDFFRKTIVKNPSQRLTIEKVLKHEVFKIYSTELHGESNDPQRPGQKIDSPKFKLQNIEKQFYDMNLSRVNSERTTTTSIYQSMSHDVLNSMKRKYEGLVTSKPSFVGLSAHFSFLESDKKNTPVSRLPKNEIRKFKEKYNDEMKICRYILDASQKMFELSKDNSFCTDEDCRKAVHESAILLVKKALVYCKRVLGSLAGEELTPGFEEFASILNSKEEWISKIEQTIESIFQEISHNILKPMIDKPQFKGRLDPNVTKDSTNYGKVKMIDSLLGPRVKILLNKLRELRRTQLGDLSIDEHDLSFLEVECSIFALHTSYHLYHYHRSADKVLVKPQSEWDLGYIFKQLREDKTHVEFPIESPQPPASGPLLASSRSSLHRPGVPTTVEEIVLKPSNPTQNPTQNPPPNPPPNPSPPAPGPPQRKSGCSFICGSRK